MKASEILKKEHRVIERLIGLLRKAVKDMEQGKEVNMEVFVRCGSFITAYSDQKHHGKEEQIFFELMEDYGFDKNEAPLKDFLEEHDQARAYTIELRKAAFQMQDDHIKKPEELIAQAHQYIDLLEHHIHNEDENLFPLADSKFSDETQKKLLKQFKEFDDNFPEEPLLKKLDDLEAMV